MTGIFLVEGMSLNISKLTLTIDEKGNISGNMDMGVGYDACIAWAEIALRQREEALRRMHERQSIWKRPEEPGNEHGRVLAAEFGSSVQSIVSAAICIDALYDHLIRYTPIDQDIRRPWIKNRTARYIQISEAIRLSFDTKKNESESIRNNLKAIFKLRDAAVHPSGKSIPPHRHPDIDIATDWQFSAFRGDVADNSVCFAVRLIWDITRGTKYKSESLGQFISGLKKRIEKLLPNGPPISANASVGTFIPD
ncbi:hypothetical protein V5F34_06795 [Xanthobacter autotrophicus]|uniref:hypothetical protein n=1 Tax=Xanthobacter autotrophicus TaxID=280 RepID=UPI00372C9C51